MSEFLAPPPTYRPVLVSTGIRASAGRTPEKTALVCEQRNLTYRVLVDRIDRVSALAQAGLGLRRGDVAAIVAPNCLEYIELVAGLSDAGIAVATLNPRQTASEIAYILADCGARVAFVAPQTEGLVHAAGANGLERVITVGRDYESLLGEARAAAPLPPIQEWEPFAIPYTSGTTGKPRGVTLSHRSRVMGFFGMASEYGCYGPDDRFLAIAPLFHGAGYAFAHSALFFGGACELLPAFDPEAVLARLKAGRMTGTFMVPTHFHAIFALERSIRERNRDFALKAIVSNAAALPQRTKELIVEYFGDGLLHETYGSTEAAIVTNLRPADQLRKIGCVGTAFPMNSVRLLGEDGKEVKRGEVGELFSISPCIFNGYWNNPEATRAGFRDGWFSAGDMARQDDEGYYYLVDRKKDMFISGGINVYPREIEEILFRLPGVRDAAVVGVPDAYWGEVGKAYIVKQGGAELDADKVIAHCRDRLAGHKIPKSVAFIDSLPRNVAGKVLKTELRKLS